MARSPGRAHGRLCPFGGRQRKGSGWGPPLYLASGPKWPPNGPLTAGVGASAIAASDATRIWAPVRNIEPLLGRSLLISRSAASTGSAHGRQPRGTPAELPWRPPVFASTRQERSRELLRRAHVLV